MLARPQQAVSATFIQDCDYSAKNLKLFKIIYTIFPDSSTFLDECFRTFQNKLRSDKQSEVLKRSIRKGKLGPGEQRENIWFGIEKCNHQIIDNESCILFCMLYTK